MKTLFEHAQRRPAAHYKSLIWVPKTANLKQFTLATVIGVYMPIPGFVEAGVQRKDEEFASILLAQTRRTFRASLYKRWE